MKYMDKSIEKIHIALKNGDVSVKELIDESRIERVVVLSSRKGAGTIDKVYKIERGEIKCLNL